MQPDALAVAAKHQAIMADFYERIDTVHKKPLHPGQIQVAKDYFVYGKRIIMSQWGRSAGKTEAALFITNVAAALTPLFLVYIITPELKQGRQIYWTSGRLQNYAPEKYIAEVNKSEMGITFTNGAKIVVAGQENYDGLRGIKPNLVIYDEFQNHRKEFHLEVMQPNLIAKSSALVIFGTPPKNRSAYYVEFLEQLKKDIAAGDIDRSFYEFPSKLNPTIAESELARTRRQLIESGNEVIWYREYEGKLVFGGEDVVFPKWNPPVHVRTHRVVSSYIENNNKLKWFTVCDPGTSSCFAVLFACYNQNTQQIFILDEIYEKDRKRTDTRNIWERIRKKEQELAPLLGEREWKRVYDSAAAWFAREIAANFHVGIIPCEKMKSEEETDISRLKMLMAQPGALTVSDRCYWFRWEIESFVTDEYGKYPDKNNHLIDCFKYLVQFCGWKLVEGAEDVEYPGFTIPTNKPTKIVPEEWADSVVENSLWINSNDLYSEYFI